jgi:hypothetical protein
MSVLSAGARDLAGSPARCRCCDPSPIDECLWNAIVNTVIQARHIERALAEHEAEADKTSAAKDSVPRLERRLQQLQRAEKVFLNVLGGVSSPRGSQVPGKLADTPSPGSHELHRLLFELSRVYASRPLRFLARHVSTLVLLSVGVHQIGSTPGSPLVHGPVRPRASR